MTTPPVMSITDEQIAEIEASCRQCAQEGGAVLMSSDHLGALITRLREAEADAKRYRALRKACNPTEKRSALMPRVTAPMDFMLGYYPDGLDAAIDAAMERTP